jgi:hypothetical protein
MIEYLTLNRAEIGLPEIFYTVKVAAIIFAYKMRRRVGNEKYDFTAGFNAKRAVFHGN